MGLDQAPISRLSDDLEGDVVEDHLLVELDLGPEPGEGGKGIGDVVHVVEDDDSVLLGWGGAQGGVEESGDGGGFEGGGVEGEGEGGEAGVAGVGGAAAEERGPRAVGVDPDRVLAGRWWGVRVLSFGLMGLERELWGEVRGGGLGGADGGRDR